MPRNEIRLQQGILQPAHMARIRAACRDTRELAMIETLATCRRAEAARLRWDEVNLSDGLVLIPRGKGGLASWTLLLESTRAALSAWQTTAPQTPWIFTVPGSGTPGRCYTPDGLSNLVRKILVRAGCWTAGLGNCHRFRRSFATAYIKQNPSDVTGLQRLMRHRDVATTARYIHYQPDDLAPRLAKVRL